MEKFASFCRIPPGGLPQGISSSSVLYRSEARYDPLTKLITVGVWIGLLALNSIVIYAALTEIRQQILSLILVAMTAVLTLGVLLGTYLFSPRGFELTPGGLVVKRAVRSFEIPYGEMVEAKRVSWTWKGMRLCASGGLHGFFGLFQFSGIGRVWTYVTNRHKTVLIRTRRGVQYMVSPEDPETFLEKLETLRKKV